MERYEQVHKLITELESDFQKFYDKGNQAAGTRIRKGMQELKVLAQDVRIEVQTIKNKGTEAEKKK